MDGDRLTEAGGDPLGTDMDTIMHIDMLILQGIEPDTMQEYVPPTGTPHLMHIDPDPRTMFIIIVPRV